MQDLVCFGGMMACNQRDERFEERLVKCRDRVLTAWACAALLRPDLSPVGKEKLAKKILKMAESEDHRLGITPAQAQEIVLSNVQCIRQELPDVVVLGAIITGIEPVLRRGMMDDIEMREAQLVLVSLQQRWDGERDRSFALMGELDAAERRLLSLFSTEWEKRGGRRRTINLAYSHYRKRLMREFVLGTA